MTQDTDPATVAADLVDRAVAAGADAADAVMFAATSLSVACRNAKPERVERSDGWDIGLRVFVGRRNAIVSSSDLRPDALRELVDRAVSMARAVPEDPYAGLADSDALSRAVPALDMEDPTEPDEATLWERARAAEEAGLAVPGVTLSDSTEASWYRSRVALAASNGFSGSYAGSGHSIVASLIAGSGTEMESDYEFSSAVYAADLTDPTTVGRVAGERTVRRLAPRRVSTAKVPVIYDPRVSRSLLSSLSSAISGPAIARGTSFLLKRMGEPVFAPGIQVVDDPHLPRGLRSKPFDAEGLPNGSRAIIDDGRLTTWLLDLRSARQLALAPTGHAARGASSPPSPSPSNLALQPGAETPEAMIGAVQDGFYVTGLMGMGVNMVTGDYSRGASGFWIENGALAYPVSEATIAGNLSDMFRNLTPASDLVRRYGIDAPTVRVDGMTVAGA